MNLIDQIFRLKRIHHFITTKSTGPPCAFSRKLGISNRQLFRLLDELKTYGLPIEYCRHRQSYFYAREVKVDISFEIKENGRSRVFGGKSAYVDNSENQWETDYWWH